jgi:glycosyltransferase involved in cell wall biosynthesis
MLPKKADFALVIPVINEGDILVSQLAAISTMNLNVDLVIADGGSTDNSVSKDTLSRFNVTSLLINEGTAGLSHQLKIAFAYCINESYEGVITMDGNGKDDPTGITGILSELKNGYDFIQGSRFIVGGRAINTPIKRLLGIKMIHAPITSLFAHKRYTDTTNGFRGFSYTLLKSESMGIFTRRFNSYDLLAHIPIAAGRNGFKIIETPVTRAYPNTGVIPTKIRGFGAEFGLLVSLAKSCFNRFPFL